MPAARAAGWPGMPVRSSGPGRLGWTSLGKIGLRPVLKVAYFMEAFKTRRRRGMVALAGFDNSCHDETSSCQTCTRPLATCRLSFKLPPPELERKARLRSLQVECWPLPDLPGPGPDHHLLGPEKHGSGSGHGPGGHWQELLRSGLESLGWSRWSRSESQTQVGARRWCG